VYYFATREDQDRLLDSLGSVTLHPWRDPDAVLGRDEALAEGRVMVAREDLAPHTDVNFSPVLFWRPGRAVEGTVGVSDIGSQADAMARVSAEYQRWVNRVIGWVRRKGVKVWGLERAAIRPDLDIRIPFVNTVYALPHALEALEKGTVGSYR
jgi:hypothetical protein